MGPGTRRCRIHVSKVCVNGPGRIAEALFGSTVDLPLAVSLFAEQSVPDYAK